MEKGLFVEAGHRFTATWGEISTRVAQRHNLMMLFSTISVAAIGAAYLPTTKTDAVHESVRLVYLLPLASLLFAKLLEMHEGQIAILRGHLANLESLDGDSKLPQFYAAGRSCGQLAEDLRSIHDHCACAMIIVYNLLGGIVWALGRSDLSDTFWYVDFWFILVDLVAAVAAVVVTIRIKGRRKKLFEEVHPHASSKGGQAHVLAD